MDDKNLKNKNSEEQDSESKREVSKQDSQDNNETKKENKVEVRLKESLEETEIKYKRALADYQNLVKRSQEERREWITNSNRQLILSLLPILDTFMLIEKHSQVKDEGLSLGIRQFQDTLRQEGLERVETIGKNFDPKFMECIETVEVGSSAGSGQENKIIEEVRAGYTLNGFVLRPALVKAGK